MTGTVRVRVRLGHKVDGRVVYRDAESAAGVAVYVPDFKAPEPDEEPAALALRGGGPWPEVLPIGVGDTVEITNLDRDFHEPFSPSAARPFDLGWLAPGDSVRVRFDRSGLVQLFCNRHPHEAAYVLVLPNPAAVVTRDDGAFVLSGLPAGRHRLIAWAPRARPVVRSIEVPAGGEVAIKVTVDLTLEVGAHSDKYGMPYRVRQGEIERER